MRFEILISLADLRADHAAAGAQPQAHRHRGEHPAGRSVAVRQPAAQLRLRHGDAGVGPVGFAGQRAARFLELGGGEIAGIEQLSRRIRSGGRRADRRASSRRPTGKAWWRAPAPWTGCCCGASTSSPPGTPAADRVLYWNKFSYPAVSPARGVQIDTWWFDAERRRGWKRRWAAADRNVWLAMTVETAAAPSPFRCSAPGPLSGGVRGYSRPGEPGR